jgi:hypothetical protein
VAAGLEWTTTAVGASRTRAAGADSFAPLRPPRPPATLGLPASVCARGRGCRGGGKEAARGSAARMVTMGYDVPRSRRRGGKRAARFDHERRCLILIRMPRTLASTVWKVEKGIIQVKKSIVQVALSCIK